MWYTRITTSSLNCKNVFKDEKIFNTVLRRQHEAIYCNNGRTLLWYKPYWRNSYEKYDKNVHIFTTEQEAIDYVEQYKMKQYDLIRKKLVVEKLKCLGKIKEINEKFKQLR